MAVEDNAEEIPDFTLEPVRRGPYVGHRRDARIVRVEADLEAEPRAIRDRDEDVHELEARLGRPVVGGGELREQTEREVGSIAQRARDVGQRVARRVDDRLQIDRRRALELRTGNRLLQRSKKRVGVHYASFCRSIFRWSWTMP